MSELASASTDPATAIDDAFDVTLPPQPYPGLRPFEKNEWPIFFGREIMTGVVVERLIDKQFMALHGDSGSGKSSLIRAGVMPRLERDHARGGATWRTTSMLPRNAPLRNLAQALAELDARVTDPTRVTDLRRSLNLGTKAAEHLARQIRRDDNDYVCVLVDQFEEIFQHAQHGGAVEVQQFVDVLTGLQLARAPGLHVILTMRSEYLGSCAHFEGLAEAINETQFLLPRMDHQGLMRAIREPARLYNGIVSRELAEAIVVDAGRDQDQLPLMQHAMMLLQRRTAPYFGSHSDITAWSLDLANYQDCGGVAKLLSDHADAVVAGIVEQATDKAKARLILERTFKALTDVNADGLAIRRPQRISELLAVTGVSQTDLVATLEPLCADGVSFLKIFGRRPYGEDELVDISHEALIRNWQQLKAWTEREAEDGVVFQRLLGMTEAYHRDPSILLGVREARDRDRWWKEVEPNQAWAARYSARHRSITVSNVRALVERSLDPQTQEFSFWREQLQIARAVWEQDKREDALLQGLPLAQAERWLNERAQDLAREDHTFINASIDERGRRELAERRRLEERERLVREAEAAQQQRDAATRRVVQRTVAGLVAALVLAIVAGGFGLFALQQKGEADSQRQAAEARKLQAETEARKAETAAEQARAARNDALLNQSRFFASEAAQSIERGDVATGLLFALEAVPDEKADELTAKTRPSSAQAATALYLAVNALREQLILEGHTGGVRDVAVTPDGARIVTGSHDKTARVWDAATGKELFQLKGHTNTVNGVAVTRDGARIVTGSHDKTARVWDATGKELFHLKGHTGGVRGVAVTQDGARIVTGSDDKTARVWDAKTGKELLKLEGHSGLVWGVAVTPDGARIVTGAWGRGQVRVWDASTGKEQFQLVGHTADVNGVAVTPNGERIITGSDDGTARVWDASTGKELLKIAGHDGIVYGVAVTMDGRIVTSSGNTARVWEANTGKELLKLAGHTAGVTDVAVTPDGRIVTSSTDNTARVWDASPVKLPGHEGWVTSVAVREATRIVTGSSDKTARVWDANTGNELLKLEGHEGPVTSVAVSNEATRIVTGSSDKTARVWDANTGNELLKLEGHTGDVTSVAMSPNAARIVTGSSDNTARMWDATTGRELLKLQGHTGGITGVAVTPDGTRIITGSSDNTARMWDATTGRELLKLQGPSITGSSGNTTRMWDATTGKEPPKLEGHTGGVTGVAVTPDGALIFTGATDNTVRVWDARTGEELLKLEGHTGGITGLAATPDGAGIVSGSYDGTARLWKLLPSGQALVDNAKRLVPRCLTPAERDRTYLGPAAPRWCGTMQKWPYDSVSAFIEGPKLVYLGKDEQAAAVFAPTLARDPSTAKRIDEAWAEAYIKRGRDFVGQGKDEEATAVFTKALRRDAAARKRIDAAWADAYISRGRNLVGQGKDAEATVAFAKVLARDPAASKKIEEARVSGYVDRGRSLLDRAARDANLAEKLRIDALAIFEEAILWARKDDVAKTVLADALLWRGRALDGLKHYRDAVASFREAIQLGNTDAYGWAWAATDSQARQLLDNGKHVEALIMAMSSQFDLTAEAKKHTRAAGLTSSSPAAYSIAVLYADLMKSSVPATDCDRLASFPFDPYRVAPGVDIDAIEAPKALAACNQAIEKSPTEPRYQYQRARAHARAANLAKGDSRRADDGYAAAIADLRGPMARGYPMAFNNMAYAIRRGQGVAQDTEKAGELYLEAFNRVIRCCWVPVAGLLVEQESQHDVGTVRRVLRELLLWADALGSEPAGKMLTELYAKGTLARPTDRLALGKLDFKSLPPWLR